MFLINFKTVPVLAFLLSLFTVQLSMAAPPVTAVLYPDIREPFRSVFTTIADGVSESLNGQVTLRSISDEDNPDSIDTWLRQNDIEAAVVLGSRGQALSKQLSYSAPMVLGAIHMSNDLLEDSYHGIVLNPDPAPLFRRLKSLAPGVEQVNIIYHREHEQWMIDRSVEIARQHGITLNPIPVDRLQEAASSYRGILASQKSDREALWLSQDSQVLDEQVILPMILKEAWDRRLIVFSSNPSHVRRGVLFALYPDNHKMGRSLGTLTMDLHDHLVHSRSGKLAGIRMLDDLLMAFNVRTAGRLGIRYTRDDLNGFDLVFPPL